MSDLVFISDTIYQLKHEYPFPGTLCRDSTTSTDLNTGVTTKTNVFSIYIPKMIRLPFSSRKLFARKTEGFIQEVGTQEILIDKKDIPGVSEIKVGDYIITPDNRRLDIGTVENYTYAFSVYVKNLEGMPL